MLQCQLALNECAASCILLHPLTPVQQSTLVIVYMRKLSGFALGLRHSPYTNFFTVWRNKKCTLSPIWRKMKCGTDESGISFESNILEISKTNRIEYEYSVASNSIRILKTERYHVMMSCRGAASSRAVGVATTSTHRSFCLLSDLTMKTTSYSRQTYPHISYVHIQTLVYK